MENNIVFRKAEKKDVKFIISLIKQRIEWMNQVGINQWNKTDYLGVYPVSYFEQNIDYFIVAEIHKIIVAATALYRLDERWNEQTNSLYVHHLVSDINYKGVGKKLLEYAEIYAKNNGFESIKLDSAVGNIKLENFYTELGYTPCGTCVDGPYHGILREKKLN